MALFVVVPLTLGLCRITPLPATRLIVFEALAVNTGSALTPIGNPQNLFLWQLSGASFAEFTAHMAPLVAVRFALLLALALYGPFLCVTDHGHTAWGCAAVFAVLLLWRPRVLARVDWGLLLVFVLMFIDLRLIAGQGAVRGAIGSLGLAEPQTLYAVGIAASQLVSIVPATIALAEYSRDWRVMAYAVNVGGFGAAVGSLSQESRPRHFRGGPVERPQGLLPCRAGQRHMQAIGKVSAALAVQHQRHFHSPLGLERQLGG